MRGLRSRDPLKPPICFLLEAPERANASDRRAGKRGLVAKPTMRITTDMGHRFLEYGLPRSSRRGVQFRGSVSTNLTTWQSGSPHCAVVEEAANQMIFRSAAPISGTPHQFIRVEMIDPSGQ